MAEESAVTVEEVAEKADEYLYDQSLTPEEYEALKHSVAELSPIFTTERAYFTSSGRREREAVYAEPSINVRSTSSPISTPTCSEYISL